MRLGPDNIEELLAIENLSFSLPWSRVLFMMEFSSPVCLSLGARCGGTTGCLAGYLFLWLVLDEAQVHTIAVKPGLRGQGVASLLLSAGLRLARQRGASWSSLEVRPSNLAARQLYEKFAFREVGHRPAYYGSEDAVLLNADLADMEE